MRKSSTYRAALLLILVMAVAAAVVFLPVKELVPSWLDWIQDLGVWGPIALAAAYIPASVLLFPVFFLTLGAGFVFGWVTGFVIASLGSILGASASFWVGRTLARGFVEQAVSRNPKAHAIDHAVAEHGFKIVFLTRLSPILPFNLLNYLFGLSKVRFRDFFWASWIGMAPGAVMYIYLGSALKNFTDLVSGNIEGGLGHQVLFFLGLAATAFVAMLITRLAKRSLDQAISEVGPKEPSDAASDASDDGDIRNRGGMDG